MTGSWHEVSTEVCSHEFNPVSMVVYFSAAPFSDNGLALSEWELCFNQSYCCQTNIAKPGSRKKVAGVCKVQIEGTEDF